MSLKVGATITAAVELGSRILVGAALFSVMAIVPVGLHALIGALERAELTSSYVLSVLKLVEYAAFTCEAACFAWLTIRESWDFLVEIKRGGH